MSPHFVATSSHQLHLPLNSCLIEAQKRPHEAVLSGLTGENHPLHSFTNSTPVIVHSFQQACVQRAGDRFFDLHELAVCAPEPKVPVLAVKAQPKMGKEGAHLGSSNPRVLTFLAPSLSAFRVELSIQG